MASGNPALQQQKQTVSNYIETLRNEDLKSICRNHGQQVSGNKPVLVSRVQRGKARAALIRTCYERQIVVNERSKLTDVANSPRRCGEKR